MNRKPTITLELWEKILTAGAALRFRGQWWLWWDLKASTEGIEKNEKYSVFAPDFFDLSSPVWEGKRWGPLSPEEFRQVCQEFLSKEGAVPRDFQAQWGDLNSKDFKISFEKVQEKIDQAELVKAVPVVFRKGLWSDGIFQRATLLERLIEAPENLIPYGFWQKEEGFLGATPEILFLREDRRFSSMALAGTRPKDLDKLSNEKIHSEFLNDSKERHEHQLVIEDLVMALASKAEVKVGETKVMELPTLFHLCTSLEGKLKENTSDFELIQTLHPTAALGVFPRSFDWKWLQTLPEQFERRGFGAPVVFCWEENRSLALVGIRRFEWKRNECRIGAGCGLVSQSDFEREWIEIQKKIESVRKLLRL